MRKIKIGISLIISLLMIVACSVFYKSACQKDILFSSSLNIYELTDEEYESIGTSEICHPTKADFRKAVLSVEMQHSAQVKNRKITVPTMADLKYTVNNYDLERYWFGNAYKCDNTSSAEYAYEFIFYSKGLNNNEIKRLFGDLAISASWLDASETMQKESKLLSDMIKFI